MADGQATEQQINQRIAMKALIVDDEGKVLLLREADTYEEGTNIGRYGLPGGRINPGEPFMDGLNREIMEETGLTVTIGKPVYVGEWFPVIKGVQNHIVAVFMLCKASSAEVRLSEEHNDYQWASPAEAAKLNVMDPEDKVLGQYFKSL